MEGREHDFFTVRAGSTRTITSNLPNTFDPIKFRRTCRISPPDRKKYVIFEFSLNQTQSFKKSWSEKLNSLYRWRPVCRSIKIFITDDYYKIPKNRLQLGLLGPLFFVLLSFVESWNFWPKMTKFWKETLMSFSHTFLSSLGRWSAK